MFIRTNHNIRKYTFAGAVRAASGTGGAAAISTARRVTRHHEVGYSWLGIFRDVPQVTRLGNLSGLHERAGIRGASVRTLTPRSAVLRMARRKPKKGYQATTRPSQETGTVQPGWPTLVMRLKKKVGNGEEPRHALPNKPRSYLPFSVSVRCVSMATIGLSVGHRSASDAAS